MPGDAPGPICSADVGDDWIDDGTTCRQKSAPWAPLGVCIQPSKDDEAAETVVETLADKAIAKIKFKIDSFAVNPDSYALVASLVRSGRITVKYDASYGTSAYYNQKTNTLELAFTTATRLPQRGLIVHECTHAAFDALRYSESTVAISEAAAFIAQCLFVRINWPGKIEPDDRLYDDDEKKDPVYAQAWKIAVMLFEGKAPAPADYTSLIEAVLKHPDYTHGRKKSGWDGI